MEFSVSNNLGELLAAKKTTFNHQPMTNGTNGDKHKTPMTNGTNGGSTTLAEYQQADHVADELVQLFGSPNSRRFYCKIAYRLTYDRIRQLASIARCDAKTSPGGYFNILCRKEMGEL